MAWEERRDALDYETDGVVVKVDDLASGSAGWGWWAASRAGAIAWKFATHDRQVTTLNAT